MSYPNDLAIKRDGAVSLVTRGRIATITIDQKLRHNAMRLGTWLAIPERIFAAEERSDVALIILRGAHGNFGSGNDLTEFGALHGDPDAATRFAKAMAAATQAIEAAGKPVIVAIEGLCYGASVALTLAGDLRVAASDATFAITPAKLGALYLSSDLHRLVLAVGTGQAKRLIYSAQPISAARALEIGLVDDVLPDGRFEDGLERLSDGILAGSSFTLRETKRMLRKIEGMVPLLETEESLASFVEATQTGQFKEGVSAFLEKRPPCFS